MDLTRRGGWLLVALSISIAGDANANEDSSRYGTLNLVIENDRVVDTDRHYTHGTRLSWVSPSGDIPAWATWAMDALPFFEESTNRRVGYAGGQLIFTPENIAQKALIKEDRPYAGWLYGAVSLHGEKGNRRDGLELALGIVGPGSGGEQIQKLVHETIRTTRPNGWGNQLSNEPGVALTYERQWRIALIDFGFQEFAIDAIPTAGATIGNIWTFGSAGITARIGQNLPKDFGPPRIRPSLPGSDSFVPAHRWGWYLFAGAEGRYVVRNIFLDGNTFSASHAVKKVRWVGDFQGGIALVFDATRVTYTQVFRTREFKGQPHTDHFGAVSLSWRF